MEQAIPHSETHWSNGSDLADLDKRSILQAMLRGLRQRCPNCGSPTLFSAYLKVSDTCTACGEELHHHRADDAPPYFTILMVGHIVVPLLMTVELLYGPPVWLHLLLWLPLTTVLSLLLLPCVKGVVVGLQWALRMHGFDAHAGQDVRIDGIRTERSRL